MSRKKAKKKQSRHINPHKLSERELTERIRDRIDRDNINDAYGLAKILLERFESEESIALFQSVLERKLDRLQSEGRGDEAVQLINEAKKRFPASLFEEAEAVARLQNLDDEQLIDHFCDQPSVPERFRYRIADYLYFKGSKNRRFIQQHREFKDVLYVREAFQDGYDPLNTPRLLSAIGASSPYKHWILLHNAIQAFQAGETAVLELIAKKPAVDTFPAFVISKLLDCQRYLEGRGGPPQKIPPADLEIFEMICGDNVSQVMLFSYWLKPGEQPSADALGGRLTWLKRSIPDGYAAILALYLKAELERSLTSHTGISKSFIKRLERISFPDTLALDWRHFVFKTDGPSLFGIDYLEDVIEGWIESAAVNEHPLFDPNRIKAELLFYIARTMLPSHRESSWFSDAVRWGDNLTDAIPFLEQALALCGENPKIFETLISCYLAAKTKTTTINRVVKRFLEKFPDNPKGYELAGDIANNNGSYAKAIGFYEEAAKRMPLNRGISQTILDCFERIIDKRNRQNGRLIDRDLKKAAAGLQVEDLTTHTPFRYLAVKAEIKKFSLELSDLGTTEKQISDFLPAALENSKILGKLVPFLFEISERHKDLMPIRRTVWERVVDHVRFETYFPLLLEAMSSMDSPSPEYEPGLADLTLGFMKKEMVEKTLSVEQCFQLLYATLSNSWNRSFIGFVCLARHCHPQVRVFELLAELVASKLNHRKTVDLLKDPEIFAWLASRQGIQFLEEFSYPSDAFEELLYIIENPTDDAAGVSKEAIAYWEKNLADDLDEFSASLVEEAERSDCFSLQAAKKLFKAPIRVQGLRGVPGSVMRVPPEELLWQLQELEKQERLYQQMKAEQKTRKQSDNKRKAENRQVSLFDLLDETGEPE